MQMLPRSRRFKRQWVRASAAVVQPLEPRTLFAVASTDTLPDISLAPIDAAQTIDLSAHFTGQGVAANTYDFNTTLGAMPVQLTPSITPLTVQNFLNYVASGAYNATVIHRLQSGFVWQSGEYTYDTTTSQFDTTPVGEGVPNEYSQPNVIGSLGLAKLSGNENSGTDGFYFNLGDNSTTLDTDNDGGFTVFGHVLGTAGLAVMNAIGNETTINEGGDFATLPVKDATAGVSQSNLLFINGVTPLTNAFSVTSDNPDVVTASVSGNTLSFGPTSPTKTGTANLTVDALDSDGDVVTEKFAVTVAIPTLSQSLGFGSGVNNVIYTDGATHAVTKVSLTSSGAATLHFSGYSLASSLKGTTETITGTSLNLDTIDLIKTTKSSILNINAGGAGASVGGILGGAQTMVGGTPLLKIVAPHVTLTGTTTVYSGVGTATFAGIADGAVFNTYAIGILNVSGPVAGVIAAGTNIGKATLKGAFSGSLQCAGLVKLTAHDVSADFNIADGINQLNITGTFSGIMSTQYLNKASIAKLNGAYISLTGSGNDLGTLKTQNMTSSVLRAVGSMGTIMIAQPLSKSQVLAGVDPNLTSPTADAVAAGDSTAGVIGLLKIGGSATADGLADSSIGATELDSVLINNIADSASTATPAVFHGIAAQRILSLKAKFDAKKFVVINVADEDVLTARLTKQGITPTNVTIEVVPPATSSM